MIINIQDLLKELVSYTVISTSHISSEAKSALSQMRKEFKRLEESSDLNKQAKMITLFIGGTIFAIIHDDWKYQNNIYPEALTDELFKTVEKGTPELEIMYKLGEQALLNLPQTFNEQIFKAEINDTLLIMPFFPQLKQHADKINLLVTFCIKYAENLDQAEVDAEDLSLVDLQVPEGVKITDAPSTPFSNTSMQILGGFIAAIGIAAVATAFVALNAATFGIAGLVVAGLGVAAILGGVGLFAAGTYKKYQSTPPDMVIDESLAPVSM